MADPRERMREFSANARLYYGLQIKKKRSLSKQRLALTIIMNLMSIIGAAISKSAVEKFFSDVKGESELSSDVFTDNQRALISGLSWCGTILSGVGVSVVSAVLSALTYDDKIASAEISARKFSELAARGYTAAHNFEVEMTMQRVDEYATDLQKILEESDLIDESDNDAYLEANRHVIIETGMHNAIHSTETKSQDLPKDSSPEDSGESDTSSAGDASISQFKNELGRFTRNAT